ncbi:DNA topoisomerase, partial [Streptococcus pyogenes]
ANRYFGFSAKQTLDYLQSLYEKKLVTYPRTDSRYLTEDMKQTVHEMLDTVGEGFKRDTKNLESIFKNEKVSDHHAI